MVTGVARARRPKEEHGGDDSAARASSQQPILNEEGEEATPEVAVSVDLPGEEHSGGGDLGVAGEEGGRRCVAFLQFSPMFFVISESVRRFAI